MKKPPNISIIRGLLFTYDIENTNDIQMEKFITSKNINDEKELSELFDKLTKPELLSYTKDDQDWFINTIDHFLSTGDNFDSFFSKVTTYFDDEVADQRKFMTILLKCLIKYQAEATEKKWTSQ